MKRDISNAHAMLKKADSDVLLKKQIIQIEALPEKEYAHEAVRLGRMRGFYFSENDWLHVRPSVQLKKAA